MNKQQYSDDIMWYDQGVYNAIMSLSDKYPNTIPVFGGALGAFNALEVGDLDRFKALMTDAVDKAKFYEWHEPSVDVARRFCHLCFVDPALIECDLCISFNELFSEV